MKTQQINPDGDLIIILHGSEEPFASLDDDADSNSQDTVPSSNDKRKQSTSKTGKPGSEQNDVRFKVSSKHLKLACRRFRLMLEGSMLEATTLDAYGRHNVTLEGFDSNALDILLHILHGKTRRVPRSVDLDLLAKIAVLVDDFNCLEEVEMFSDMWIDTLSSQGRTLPKVFDRDLVLWILISSVFNKPQIQKAVVRVAIHEGSDKFNTLGLPIRQKVTNDIDTRREKLLKDTLGWICGFINTLCRDTVCQHFCDSGTLGAFMKLCTEMLPRLNLLLPYSDSPFSGLTYSQAATVIRTFKAPTCPSTKNPTYYAAPTCRVQIKRQEMISNLNRQAKSRYY